jgi:hypothetical protein
MRALPCLLAVAALAACDSAADRNESAAPPLQPGSSSGDPAPPSPAQPPPAAAAEGPAAPATASATIPAAFHGVYDANEDGCARPSEYRLRVSAREFRFHESIGTVRAVTAAGPSEIVVDSDYQGEGEAWRSSRRLVLDGEKLTISGDGTSIVRIRCPASSPS